MSQIPTSPPGTAAETQVRQPLELATRLVEHELCRIDRLEEQRKTVLTLLGAAAAAGAVAAPLLASRETSPFLPEWMRWVSLSLLVFGLFGLLQVFVAIRTLYCDRFSRRDLRRLRDIFGEHLLTMLDRDPMQILRLTREARQRFFQLYTPAHAIIKHTSVLYLAADLLNLQNEIGFIYLRNSRLGLVRAVFILAAAVVFQMFITVPKSSSDGTYNAMGVPPRGRSNRLGSGFH